MDGSASTSSCSARTVRLTSKRQNSSSCASPFATNTALPEGLPSHPLTATSRICQVLGHSGRAARPVRDGVDRIRGGRPPGLSSAVQHPPQGPRRRCYCWPWPGKPFKPGAIHPCPASSCLIPSRVRTPILGPSLSLAHPLHIAHRKCFETRRRGASSVVATMRLIQSGKSFKHATGARAEQSDPGA